MHEPTERVRRAERSKIRVMFDLAEATDRDLVRLEVGEPDFDTPAHVVDAAAEAARSGATHYTPNAGLPETRRAISDAMADDYGVEHDVDEIAVTVGGMEALHLATLSVVGPPRGTPGSRSWATPAPGTAVPRPARRPTASRGAAPPSRRR